MHHTEEGNIQKDTVVSEGDTVDPQYPTPEGGKVCSIKEGKEYLSLQKGRESNIYDIRQSEKCNIRHGKEYAETQQKGRESNIYDTRQGAKCNIRHGKEYLSLQKGRESNIYDIRQGEKWNIRHGKEYAETQQKGRELQHRRGEGILDIKEGGGEGISSRNIRPHRTPSSQLKRLEEEVAINEFTRDETPNIFKLSYKIPR